MEPIARKLMTVDKKKTRVRLWRYERQLGKEKSQHGFHRDGGGVRYSLGPLYLLVDDLDGALTSFAWFDEEFPDDMGEPGQYLCWTLALHRAGREIEAIGKLRRTAFQNLYLLPHLFGLEVPDSDIWLGSSDEWPSYVEQVPAECFALWTPPEIEWARAVYEGPVVSPAVARWIEIHEELRGLPRGERRSELVEEAFALRR